MATITGANGTELEVINPSDLEKVNPSAGVSLPFLGSDNTFKVLDVAALLTSFKESLKSTSEDIFSNIKTVLNDDGSITFQMEV